MLKMCPGNCCIKEIYAPSRSLFIWSKAGLLYVTAFKYSLQKNSAKSDYTK